MNNRIIDITFLQLASAYAFIAIVVFIILRRRLGREQEILLSALRMTAQLILVGYVLDYIFARAHVVYTLGVLVLMEAFAIRNVFARVKTPLSPPLRKVIALAMAAGSGLSIFYFLLVVVGLRPWYSPRYFIPISGMLIGNSMTGVSLGINRLVDGMKSRKELIEGALMLGATPARAAKRVIDDSFAASIMPTVNSMVGMGIVFLPGMMTGQILSGTSPVTAIRYQIAIMLGILGSVAITVFIALELGYRTFFNARSQLVEAVSQEEKPPKAAGNSRP